LDFAKQKVTLMSKDYKKIFLLFLRMNSNSYITVRFW